MNQRNIQITQSFVDMIQSIAIQSKENGSKYQKISSCLADFVQSKLKNYNANLYELLKADRFQYSRNGTWLGWRGGGVKTIERLLKSRRCSNELFNIVGYYFFKEHWTLEKQEQFTSCNNDACTDKSSIYLTDVSQEFAHIYHQKFKEHLMSKDTLIVLLIHSQSSEL